MSGEFLTARLKAQRARIHINSVRAACDAYVASADFDLLVGPHADAPKDSVVAVMKARQIVPEQIALMVGDAVHNLRTALDHAVADLAVANGKSRSGTSFPFDVDAAAFGRSYINKIAKLNIRAARLIFRLRPYGDGNALLYQISNLDNLDKHRSLNLCAGFVQGLSGSFSSDKPITMNQSPFGSLQQGVHLFTIQKDAVFEQNLQATIYVMLDGDEGPAVYEPISDKLVRMADYVERILGMLQRYGLER